MFWEGATFPLYISLHALRFVLLFKKKWETTETLLYSTLPSYPFLTRHICHSAGKISVWYLPYSHRLQPLLLPKNAGEMKSPFIIYLLCVLSAYTHALPFAKGIRSVAITAKIQSDKCGVSQVSYTVGYWACQYKHSSCELWFVSCRERRKFSKSDLLLMFWFLHALTYIVKTYPDSDGCTCSCGKSHEWHDSMWGASLHLTQGKYAVYTIRRQLPTSMLKWTLYTLPSNESCSRVQRGTLWDKAFFTGRFWLALFISMYRTDNLLRKFIYFYSWCIGPGFWL